jgi:hypothetical protein
MRSSEANGRTHFIDADLPVLGAGAHLPRCATMQLGGVGIMRFFKQAERPGGTYRLVAAVAGAVAAAVLAGDSTLLHWPELPAVTDVLTAPGSAMVASGKIGNASWQVIFRPSAQLGDQPGMMCFYGLGQAFFPNTSITCGPFPRTPPKPFTWARPEPAWFFPIAEDQLHGGIGVVGADITSILLRLDDRRQLKLIPVERYGYRLVAFASQGRSGSPPPPRI